MFKKISIFICSISVFLATTCHAGEITFEPNAPQVFTNIMDWGDILVCIIKGEHRDASMEAIMLKNSGKLNDTKLFEGDTFNFNSKSYFSMDFEADSQMQIINLSSKSVIAVCEGISV